MIDSIDVMFKSPSLSRYFMFMHMKTDRLDVKLFSAEREKKTQRLIYKKNL